jgi:exosortase/archaeosortase family protein
VRAVLSFLALFALYYACGHFALASPWGERWAVEPWVRANVATALAAASPLGITARAEDRTIVTDRPLLDVNQGCDGLDAALIVVAAIASFPAVWPARWPGILLGCAALFALNARRIGTLLWTAVHHPAWLETLHVDVWQPLMMLAAFGLFLLWSTWLPPRFAPAGSAGKGR